MTLHTLLLVLAAACFVVVIICAVGSSGTVIGMGALGWVGAGALALTLDKLFGGVVLASHSG
jgi:hypothetical protein